MRFLKLVLAAATVGAWVAGSLPAPAAAQSPPSYQSSDPAKDEMMDHPPAEVTVTFDQPLDQSSWMNVLDECDREIDAGPATVDLNEMTVEIGKKPSGMYKVVYKAVGLGTVTGSSTSSFEFMVHHGKPCNGKKKPPHDHDKKKDDPHDHDDDRDDRHMDHDDDDGDAPGHSDHPGMTGMSGSNHSGHSTASDTGPGTGPGKHGRHREDHPRPTPPGASPPPFAGGTAGAPVSADAEAVLVGLGLALAIGVLGGWLLRMSGTPSGAS